MTTGHSTPPSFQIPFVDEAFAIEALSTDPAAPVWAQAAEIVFSGGFFGEPTPGFETRVWGQWSPESLCFLFVCPYQRLHLKPNPVTGEESFGLWEWDVAEVFLGVDFDHIGRYREFEVSPQAEWVDLEIDLDRGLDTGPESPGWQWRSGVEVAARIDHEARVWYGAMRIPYAAVDTRPAQRGNQLRANFFRCQGAEPERKYLAWQAPGRASFHVPERFGVLELGE
jgi:hypothetical protein